MGADLYIKKLQKPAKEKWQAKFDEAVKDRNAAIDEVAKEAAQKRVTEAYDAMYAPEFYFRDSYNSTSVLWTLGLSWWQDMEYDVEDEDSDINVSAAACERFMAKIEAAQQKLPTREELERRHAQVDETGDNSVEGWHQYYRDKRDRLIAFLRRAAEHGGMMASC